ncbi:hypothetical protein PMAYCL1PPCAC_15454, partial [Pristionchus mayeri]
TSFLSEVAFILSIALGIGFGMDALFGKNLPVLTAISILPAILAILIVLPLHETPKFLLINRNDRSAAIASLEYYRGVTAENEDTLKEIEMEKALEAGDEHTVSFESLKLEKNIPKIWQGVKEVLSMPYLRMAFFLGAATLQIVVGMKCVVYFSTDLLEDSFSPQISQIATFVFMISEFSASLFGLLVIERFGRRTLVVGLGIANVMSLCLYIASHLLITVWNPFRWGQIVALVLFGMTYGVALGPIAYFITSELVPQRHRSIVQSMVLGFNTLMNFMLSFITLPCYKYIGVLSFIPLLVIPAILCIIFLHNFLPETRGREVHEVVEELMERHNNYGGKNKVRRI